jgi:hypothetical protein
MTQDTTTNTTPPTLATRVARRATRVNWRKIMIAWIGCVLGLYALMFVIPSPVPSIPDLVARDLGIPAIMWAWIFLVGFGHYLRGVKPRYQLMTSMIGPILYTVATAHYVHTGEASIAALAGHGGLFLVCYLVLAALAQDVTTTGHRFRFHRALMPALGITLSLYLASIGLQPSVGVAGWIVTTLGEVPLQLLGIWFSVVIGYVLHNHIEAAGLFLALLSQHLYAIAGLVFCFTTPGVPLAAIGSHVMLAITTGLIIVLQTQEQL